MGVKRKNPMTPTQGRENRQFTNSRGTSDKILYSNSASIFKEGLFYNDGHTLG